MALVKGTNSYADVAEADAYMSNRAGNGVWTASSTPAKEGALVAATLVLETQIWNGYAVSADQPLAFPRVGFYLDHKVGYRIPFVDIPARLVQATVEQALHILTNESILDETSVVPDIKVGPISLTGIRPAPRLSNFVHSIIAPMLKQGGGTGWWRAN